MERKTHEKLQQINMTAAMRHKKDLIRTEKPYAETEDILKKAYNKSSGKERKVIGNMLDSGMLHRETKFVNEKASRDIEREVEARIKHEIRSGRLEPAKRTDAFMRKQMEWEKRRR